MALTTCAIAAVLGGHAQAKPALPRPHDELLAAEAARLAAHASQPEAAGALATLATLDEDVDPSALEAAVRGGLGKGAHPLVAAQASWLLAHLYDQRGMTKEAGALRASLGLLSHYFVIGPFGEGRGSLNTAFPPELEPEPPSPPPPPHAVNNDKHIASIAPSRCIIRSSFHRRRHSSRFHRDGRPIPRDRTLNRAGRSPAAGSCRCRTA